ncbi:DMT family transporter [Georgenia subflava]|uniref:QacE family quaternary ammonium compound efflux SMR transporter n=1 Tax=Georgenia subflava TaxID=1622177 RepID=A0A6N7EDW3_9MICO|nr:multidrug efflux SMR transporter [Georgenia subflava]MPV36299.1 QacE family quaternary ammonium compound efflux SMR transporter [Georgenia subflava]
MSWVWLAAAIVAELAGTLSLRASDGLRERAWLVPVVAGYAVAFTFLGLALRAGMPVGVAYGIWTATGIALIALLARAIWQEPLTRRMLAGIALITLGVVLVEIG